MRNSLIATLMATLVVAACAPVGSDEWCEKMDNKPDGDWTNAESSQYTKYCLLGMDPTKWCDKMEEKPPRKACMICMLRTIARAFQDGS